MTTPDGAVHIMPQWEEWHIESADCPCHPYPGYEKGYRFDDSDTRLLWIHRAVSEEGN